MLGSLLAGVLALSPDLDPDVGSPADGRRFAPPPVELGYGLRETWDDAWRRFLDRQGRPDPRGPLLQPAPELQRPEYELTLAVAEHPLYLERDWGERSRGARVFIHSDDEFSFFNEVRAKERVPMGRVAALGLRYDRLELREVRSSLFQLAFAFPDIAGSGAFVEIRPIARFEKPDLDVELALGWARPQRGRVQLRVFSLDTFNNASEALAANRERPLELRVQQREPGFGLSAEAELQLVPGLRAGAYVGGVVPTRQDFSYRDEDRFDFQREQSATLAGGMLEWAIPRTPVWFGVSGTTVHTRQLDRNFDNALIDWVQEHESRGRVYAFARLDDDWIPGFVGSMLVELSGSVRHTRLPEHTSELGSVRADQSMLALLRAHWLATRVFGIELAYLGLDRIARGEGPLPEFLTETNHRMSTRVALAFAPHVWISFGVGWDLDRRRDGAYDQGGMTLTARW